MSEKNLAEFQVFVVWLWKLHSVEIPQKKKNQHKIQLSFYNFSSDISGNMEVKIVKMVVALVLLLIVK